MQNYRGYHILLAITPLHTAPSYKISISCTALARNLRHKLLIAMKRQQNTQNPVQSQLHLSTALSKQQSLGDRTVESITVHLNLYRFLILIKYIIYWHIMLGQHRILWVSRVYVDILRYKRQNEWTWRAKTILKLNKPFIISYGS